MAKAFFDVFPSLQLEGDLKEIIQETQVEKVSTTKKQDFIRIYLTSNVLIDKSFILIKNC